MLIWVSSISYPLEDLDDWLPTLNWAQRYQEVMFVQSGKM